MGRRVSSRRQTVGKKWEFKCWRLDRVDERMGKYVSGKNKELRWKKKIKWR